MTGAFKILSIFWFVSQQRFSDYISHILPELGEENIQEMSFDLYAYKELKSLFMTAKTAITRLKESLLLQTKNR